MNNLNTKLGLGAVVLFGLSLFSYWYSVSSAERFERGQSFLQNLDPDSIATIEIRQGEEAVTLQRQGEEFLIRELQDYKAKNESVNRVVKDLMEITLAREVGSSESLAEELELEPPGPETVDVALKDSSGTEMVRLRVGKQFETDGHYLRRLDLEDETIYLSESAVRIEPDPDRFVQKEILDVAVAEIQRIEGPDFEFARNESDVLELLDIPSGRREEPGAAGRVKNLPSRLQFEKVFLADDPEVADLAFEETFRYELKDGSGYVLQSTQKDDRYFLKVSGFHTVERVEIALDSTDEELEEKADVLHRGEAIQEFNAFHGSWVYELPKLAGEKLDLRRRDLTESAT